MPTFEVLGITKKGHNDKKEVVASDAKDIISDPYSFGFLKILYVRRKKNLILSKSERGMI